MPEGGHIQSFVRRAAHGAVTKEGQSYLAFTLFLAESAAPVAIGIPAATMPFAPRLP